MSQNKPIPILFPLGRMVAGDLYTLNDKDASGQPRVIKSGPNAGKPSPQCYFALAIAKVPGHTHWKQTDWGAAIYDAAVAAWPQGQYAAPLFAWKIIDGDSAIPNKSGTAPNTREGYPGHWVISFNGSFLPAIYSAGGERRIDAEGAVKRGYFIRVAGNTQSNMSTQSPGMYVNYVYVEMVAYGEEITFGPDPSIVFKTPAGPLPAGASAVPVSAGYAPVSAGSAPVSAPMAPAAPPTAVQPSPSFLSPPPQPPSAPPVAPRMCLNGWVYDEAIKVGWTEATLRQAGYL